ncbi:MAG: NAD-dependent epimerase/dehydratase family protein [Planctomycetaceae bacterium]
MRKLILGCGYLGRRVARTWRADGDEVAALTRSSENARALEGEGIVPIVGDVTRSETLAALPEADVVLYAVAPDRAAGADPDAVTLGGLENVVERLAGRVGRLVFVSSVSVYGQQAGEWVDEASPTVPKLENGKRALAAERIVRERFVDRAGGVAIMLRLAGIYGPGRLLRRIEEVRAGAPIAGDPDGWLNLIHVDDAATAVLAAASRAARGSTWLVCDDRPVLRREYHAQLAALLDASPPTFTSGEGASRTRGLNKRCSNRRLRQELGVTLRHPTIAEGLPHAIERSS